MAEIIIKAACVSFFACVFASMAFCVIVKDKENEACKVLESATKEELDEDEMQSTFGDEMTMEIDMVIPDEWLKPETEKEN
jgi:hypothetical protein